MEAPNVKQQAILDFLKDHPGTKAGDVATLLKFKDASATLSHLYGTNRVTREPFKTEQGRTSYMYSLATGKVAARRRISKSRGGHLEELMIAIPFGKNKTELTTISQAEQIWKQLNVIFANRA
jgi:predicted ArsR family transcriptional regulator